MILTAGSTNHAPPGNAQFKDEQHNTSAPIPRKRTDSPSSLD